MLPQIESYTEKRILAISMSQPFNDSKFSRRIPIICDTINSYFA